MIQILLLTTSLLLTSCTFFTERQVSSKAKDILTEDIRHTLDNEQKSVVADRNTRGKDFTEFVLNHTQLDVTDTKEISASQYQLEIKIHTVNPEVRKMILEMLAKLDDRTARAFNFAEALALIQQQRSDLKIEVDQRSSLNLRNVNGEWIAHP